MARIAHIGHGYWGKNLARNFHELGALVAVVDANAEVAEAAAADYGVKAMNFEAVLSDDGIDGVSLASPAVLHAEQIEKALAAGKHVFVEKPLALSVEKALPLVELAETSGRVLMVGHLLRYHPVFEALLDIVQRGDLGKIRYAYSNRMSLGKFRTEENVLWSFAPHDLSMLLALFDEEPDQCTAQGCVMYTSGIADMATLQMSFPNGARGHVQTCWMHPFKEQRLVLIAENGMAVFEDSAPVWEDKLKIYRHRIDVTGPVPLPHKAEAESVVVPKAEPLRRECAHFIECVENGATPRTDGREGLRVLNVLQRAEQALQQNLQGNH